MFFFKKAPFYRKFQNNFGEEGDIKEIISLMLFPDKKVLEYWIEKTFEKNKE